jgi:hypothetical protein
MAQKSFGSFAFWSSFSTFISSCPLVSSLSTRRTEYSGSSLSVSLSLSVSVSLSVSLSVSISLCLCLCLSVSVSISVSISLSSLCLSVCLSLYLSLFVSLSLSDLLIPLARMVGIDGWPPRQPQRLTSSTSKMVCPLLFQRLSQWMAMVSQVSVTVNDSLPMTSALCKRSIKDSLKQRQEDSVMRDRTSA